MQAGDLLDVLMLRYSLALGLASLALVAVPVKYMAYTAAAAVVVAAPVPETASPMLLFGFCHLIQ